MAAPHDQWGQNFFPVQGAVVDIVTGGGTVVTGARELIAREVAKFGYWVSTAIAIGIGSPTFDLLLQLGDRDGTTFTTKQTLRTSAAQPQGKVVYVDLELEAAASGGGNRALRVLEGQVWRLSLTAAPGGGSMSGAILPVIYVKESAIAMALEASTVLQKVTTQ